MSEEERKVRQEYKLTRKKWINYQLIALAATLLLALCMTFLAVALNKTYYVKYEEKGQTDYGVTLKDNDFFDESYLDKKYTYVAALIDTVHAFLNNTELPAVPPPSILSIATALTRWSRSSTRTATR